VSVRGALRVLRPAKPRQAVGDPCEDCGAMLVCCVQCGVESRCLECYPYERPTALDAKVDATVRLARDHPQAGLLGGAIRALVPALLIWAGMTYTPPGILRALAGLAGTVACCAFLAAGAAWGSLPLPGEVPHCRRYDSTPYDRRALAGFGALTVQVALMCTGIATA
jgi:hypothetical protein